MHGRLKVKSTAEQHAEKEKERHKKLLLYTGGCQKIAEKRKGEEYDAEALNISGQVLQGNPDHYTLWNFRKEIIMFIKSDRAGDDEFLQEILEGELLLTESCLRKNRKSYGAWHHRAWVMQAMPKTDWKKELLICGRSLQLDERNFHCWNYRRTVCELSDVNPKEELSFTLDKIEANFSNYSAWHYRSSLLPKVHPGKTSMGPEIDKKTLLNEFELVKNAVFTDPNDQSAWFYHRWLLGRAETKLKLLCCYMDKKINQITIVFSKPIKQPETSKVSVQVNNEIKLCNWKSPEDSPFASSVWTTEMPCCTVHEPKEILIAFKEGEEKEELKFSQTNCDLVWNNTLRENLYSLELDVSTAEVLQQELESCQQLLDLEPDNKWTLLTCVVLLRALNSKIYEEQVLNYLDQLTTVDPSRRNYYNDQRSKCVIENFLLTFLSGPERVLNLSGKNLTLFCHSDHLVYLRSLDFSNNKIVSLHSLRCLVSLENLILDHNSIHDCSGLESMARLQSLSLNHNSINTVDNVSSLRFCLNLQHLSIQSNPISEANDCREKIYLLFPSLQVVI